MTQLGAQAVLWAIGFMVYVFAVLTPMPPEYRTKLQVRWDFVIGISMMIPFIINLAIKAILG